MNAKEIKSIYQKKIKIFHEHNKNYYEKNKPTIIDADFDKLKLEILELENQYIL